MGTTPFCERAPAGGNDIFLLGWGAYLKKAVPIFWLFHSRQQTTTNADLLHAYTHTHTRTRIHAHAYTHTHTRSPYIITQMNIKLKTLRSPYILEFTPANKF